MEHTDGTFTGGRTDGVLVTLPCVGRRTWRRRGLCSRADMPCRIGHMTIVDADTVNDSNINRQLPALHSTLGMQKAEVVGQVYWISTRD